MQGPKKQPPLIKAYTSRFSFRESCDFLLDYNGFMLSDQKSGEGKFIKISFNRNRRKAKKQHFKCFYKMLSAYGRSLN
ncbi:hypothetical protein ACW6QP_10455 [Salegentibacter sp. HM20]